MKLKMALILLAVTSAFSSQTPTTLGQERTFEITASISPESLRSDQYRQHGIFWVDTIIRNITDRDQQIVVWSQSGWSWIADSTEIVPAIAAQQNVSRTIAIRHGQNYKLSVELAGSSQIRRPITFRLGFYAKANRPISVQPKFAILHANEIAWSNPISLKP